jgi:hypothetical protein
VRRRDISESRFEEAVRAPSIDLEVAEERVVRPDDYEPLIRLRDESARIAHIAHPVACVAEARVQGAIHGEAQKAPPTGEYDSAVLLRHDSIRAISVQAAREKVRSHPTVAREARIEVAIGLVSGNGRHPIEEP